MEIIVILIVLAIIYALLHPLKTLGLIFRFGVSVIGLVIILVIAVLLLGD